MGLPNTRSKGPVALIAAAQNLTANEANVGDSIDTRGADKLVLFIDFDTNDSTGAYIILYGQRLSGGDTFIPVDMTAFHSAADTPHKYTFGASDQKRMFVFELCGAVPFVQVMVKAAVVGATAARFVTAHYCLR